MEPHERGDHAEPLAAVVEHANGEAEVEVPVVEAECDLVRRLREHGEDAHALPATIRGRRSVFERGGREREQVS